MTLQIKLTVTGDLASFARDTHLRFARGARLGAERFAARAKIAYRGAVRNASLGDRLANTVRVDIYPKSAAVRTHRPAVVVWSKAPKILFAFATGVTIRHHDGLWLAIPTDRTPRRRGRPVSPEEVESMFDQDLIFIKGRGGQMLAFIDRTPRGKLKRARAKGRSVDIQARFDKLVLMFVMVRQVRLEKRLDWQGITDDLAGQWADLFGAEIARALAA